MAIKSFALVLLNSNDKINTASLNQNTVAEGKFATSITCMDGRIQIPLTNWIKENYSVDYVDTITEPGVDKKIAENEDLESIKTKARISINAHKSGLIVVSGHFDCAGNPVSDEEHIAHIKKSVEIISSWNLDVKIIGLWVDGTWNVNLVYALSFLLISKLKNPKMCYNVHTFTWTLC